MQVSAFDFSLPKDLIAQRPARPRDSARLLNVEPSRLSDHLVSDLPDLLTPGDLLVFNDTRVLPARLSGRRGEASIEVTLHQPVEDDCWRVFAKPARKCRIGDRLDFAEDLTAEVIERGDHGEVTLRFSCDSSALIEHLKQQGRMPLPPYISRPKSKDPIDDIDYQTMFAKRDGAVAAPTASLHFTPSLLAALKARDINHAFVTLHVGAGTFLPVRSETTEDHEMHAERFDLSNETIETIQKTRARGGRIIACGTTVLRTLEAAAGPEGILQAGAGETWLFITPGYRFRVVDRLLTNFHLPCSTLFMLVAAFSGLERMQSAYDHAIKERYRFFSFGDACLLTPKIPTAAETS
ncbi:MAG: tRNA preQ1(34) S-adenosylmethionine ribosyltransferase-isomerase QueA [Geminicoccaceae bacterium]